MPEPIPAKGELTMKPLSRYQRGILLLLDSRCVLNLEQQVDHGLTGACEEGDDIIGWPTYNELLHGAVIRKFITSPPLTARPRRLLTAVTGPLTPNFPLLPPQAGWHELVDETTRMEPAERLQSMEAGIERLEGLRGGKPGGEESRQAVMSEGKVGSMEKDAPAEDKPVQTQLSDFELYKCAACGRE
jgi:hypothetical protein